MTREEVIKELEFAKLTDDYMLHEAADTAIKMLRQKTGKWIHHSITEGFKYERTPYECNRCNKFERETSNYCPNCGAKMESENK